jgi:hypothetical protein
MPMAKGLNNKTRTAPADRIALPQRDADGKRAQQQKQGLPPADRTALPQRDADGKRAQQQKQGLPPADHTALKGHNNKNKDYGTITSTKLSTHRLRYQA